MSEITPSEMPENPTCYSTVVTASCDPTAEAVTETPTQTTMNYEELKERLDALGNSDPESLRRTYRELIGCDAATFGSQFLQRRCAHRLQELAFGGLTAEELQTLAYIADHDPQINKSLRSNPRSANDTRGVIFRCTRNSELYKSDLLLCVVESCLVDSG